jgi:uncharacterized membrane protein
MRGGHPGQVTCALLLSRSVTDDNEPAGNEEPDDVPGLEGHPGQVAPELTTFGISRRGTLEYDRILFFSDAVFAIAITLLAVSLHVPNTSRGPHHLMQIGAELSHARQSLLGFVISFLAIGLFWMAHHSTFRYITAFDRRLTLLNLLFLGTVAFLPYPTEVLSTSPSGQKGATIFYALCAAGAGILETVIWLYATRPGSGLASKSASQVRLRFALRGARAPVVFLLSIPITIVSSQIAEYFWLLIWVIAIVIDRLFRAAEAHAPGAPGAEPSTGYGPFSRLRRRSGP